MPTLVLLLLAQPFVRSMAGREETSPCLWWADPTIEFQQSTSGNPATGPSALTAVTRSFATWHDTMQCSSVGFAEGARTASRKVGVVTTGSNINLVLFRAKSCVKAVPAKHTCWEAGTCANSFDCWDGSAALLGTTTVSFETDTGRIYDADIELNAADQVFTTVNSPVCGTQLLQSCVATDVQNTVTHEIGHFMGLGHTARSNSVMNASAAIGERTKRIIDQGTQSFVCAVYEKDRTPDTCVAARLSEHEVLGKAGCSVGAEVLAMGMLALGAVRRRRT